MVEEPICALEWETRKLLESIVALEKSSVALCERAEAMEKWPTSHEVRYGSQRKSVVSFVSFV